MSWAQYALRREPQPTGVWPYPLSRRGKFVFAAVALVAVLLFTAVAGYGAWRYFRLSALDDYRTGYSTGAAWRADGEHRSCVDQMTARYGDVGWSARAPGWGEFLAGCQEGLRGGEAASWYNLRDHLWANID